MESPLRSKSSLYYAAAVFIFVLVFFWVLSRIVSEPRAEQMRLRSLVDLGIQSSKLESALNAQVDLTRDIVTFLSVNHHTDLNDPILRHELTQFTQSMVGRASVTHSVLVSIFDPQGQRITQSFAFSLGQAHSAPVVIPSDFKLARAQPNLAVYDQNGVDTLVIAEPLRRDNAYRGFVFVATPLEPVVQNARLQWQNPTYTLALYVPGAEYNYNQIPSSKLKTEQRLTAPGTAWHLYPVPVNAWSNPYFPLYIVLLTPLGVALLLASLIYMLNQERLKNRWLAHFDPLTDVPNRRYLQHRFAKEMQSNSSGALLLFNIDNFRSINERYGYAFGDQVLLEVAGRIRTALSSEQFLASLGGDEFVMLCPKFSVQQVHHVIAKVQANMSVPITVNRVTVTLITLVGISLYPAHGTELSQLIEYADHHTERAERLEQLPTSHLEHDFW